MNGQNRCRRLTCAEEQEPKKKPKKKTKKGRHLTMLGVAGGEKLCVDPVGANVMADANLEVDRTQGSWAVAP